MESAYFGTDREYHENIDSLMNTSSRFLDSLREQKLKFVSIGTAGRIDTIENSFKNAEISLVKNMYNSISNLNSELAILIGRAQVVKNNYSRDKSLKHFFGNYNSNSELAHKKLLEFIDGNVAQLDAVISAYSKIDRERENALSWIATILSENTSSKTTKKATNAKKMLQELYTAIEELRVICHDARYSFLGIRDNVAKYASPRTKIILPDA